MLTLGTNNISKPQLQYQRKQNRRLANSILQQNEHGAALFKRSKCQSLPKPTCIPQTKERNKIERIRFNIVRAKVIKDNN